MVEVPMSARNPTFIVSNGKGSSYLFRTIIPREIRKKIYIENGKPNNPREIRISLLTGLKSEAKQLSQLLKYQVDRMFDDIRNQKNSMTCVFSIKRELKAHLYRIKTNGHNGEQVINEPLNLSHKVNINYYHQPMERKLIEDYVNGFKYQDIINFCEDNDVDYDKEADFPVKHIRRCRQILLKKIGDDIGYLDFANDLARDILNGHLSDMDFEGFKKFFDKNRIDHDLVADLLENPDGISVEDVIKFLETEIDIITIARRIGVQSLFTPVEHVYENDQNEIKEEPLEMVWNGLKSDGIDSRGTQVLKVGKTQREKPGNVKKLSAVFGEYIEEMITAGIWNAKSQLEKRATLLGLVEIVGDLPINELSFDIGRAYKQTLMKLPANRNKKAQYRDLKIDEILKLEDVTPMSVQTVNNNLATVIAFMNWARKHGYVKENHFEGLKLPSTKQPQDERKPFTDADLQKIFDPKVYPKETAGVDFRYWVPLLGLYTGARINEICQMHVRDIKQVDGLWCMDINKKSDDPENPKRLKNKASERLIPLHDSLIELGFIDFVNKQRKGKVVRLFEDLYYNINDGHSRKAGRWFNQEFIHKKLGIKEKTFHSFRHTVADRLKQLGIAESYISELLGHSSGDSMTFGRYGKRYQPKVLMEEAVKRIRYEVDF
jgi:integrase